MTVVALGGNAIAEGGSSPQAQRAAVVEAADQVAGLISRGYRVVLTHGNGRQVGDLLIQNERSKELVDPHPLHWCVAETQATIGLMISLALEAALESWDLPSRVATIVTRVRVAADDPAWQHPTKPVGPYCDEEAARAGIARGERWEEHPPNGWCRVVPSPMPEEILDLHAIRGLLEKDVVVVAAGGGGIPVIAHPGGDVGVDAVLDKDLTGALLASSLSADYFVIATDVDGAILNFGTEGARLLGRLTNEELRTYMAAGHFPPGSMGPKVAAALQFVDKGGKRAVITSLHRLAQGLEASAGTIVEPLSE